MAITYKSIWPELPNFKVPVLHRVDYGYSDTPQAHHEWSLKDRHIREWCKGNCRSAFYFHPGYTREKFVQFEDDEEATVFALKWI